MTHPANLTAPCPEVPAFDGTTADELISADLELVQAYRDCATRHNALVRAL